MCKQSLGQGAEPGGGISSNPLNLSVFPLFTLSVLLSLVLFLQLLGLHGTLCAETKMVWVEHEPNKRYETKAVCSWANLLLPISTYWAVLWLLHDSSITCISEPFQNPRNSCYIKILLRNMLLVLSQRVKSRICLNNSTSSCISFYSEVSRMLKNFLIVYMWPLCLLDQQFATPEGNVLLSSVRYSSQRPLRQWQKWQPNQKQAVHTSQQQSSNRTAQELTSPKICLEIALLVTTSLLGLQTEIRIIIAVHTKGTTLSVQTTSAASFSTMTLLSSVWLQQMFDVAVKHLKCLNSQIFPPKLFKHMMISFQLIQWCLSMGSTSEH